MIDPDMALRSANTDKRIVDTFVNCKLWIDLDDLEQVIRNKKEKYSACPEYSQAFCVLVDCLLAIAQHKEKQPVIFKKSERERLQELGFPF